MLGFRFISVLSHGFLVDIYLLKTMIYFMNWEYLRKSCLNKSDRELLNIPTEELN